MNFRKIGLADKTIFLEMTKQFFASPAVLHGVPEQYMENNFDAMVDGSPFAEGYIFEDESKSAGYCFLTRNYSTEVGGMCLWMEELFVLPEYRSRGVGREFFKFLEQEKRGEICRIRMEVEPCNTRAMALYEKLGFSKLDYVQMVKDNLS